MGLFSFISRLAGSKPLSASKGLKSPQNNTGHSFTRIEVKDKEKRYSYQLKNNYAFRADLGQDELRSAILTAEDPIYPRRYLLLQFYKEAMRDFHLQSQVRSAINKVLSSPWAIVDWRTKEINQELTELMQAQWFEKTSRLKLEAEFYGHSLIEIGNIVKDKDYGLIISDVKLFPREHVSPELGLLLFNPEDIEGIPFREDPYNYWFIEAGESDDLGLLSIASKYVLYKKYGISDWSRSMEKWADPLLIVRSSSSNDTENDKKADFAANFGNNGWAILDEDDKIDLLERNNSSGYQIFKDFLTFINEENSKGINGQVSTSDQKSFVGSAEVQERLMEEYTEARLRNLMYFHNKVTLPKISNLLGGQTAYAPLKDYIWMPLEFLKENRGSSNHGNQPNNQNRGAVGGAPVGKSKNLSWQGLKL